MIVYVDSSIGVQAVLDTPQRPALESWFDDKARTLISSRLFQTEIIRVLRREGLPLTDADGVLDRVNLISLTADTHDQAEGIEQHIRTLGALHVATAMTLAIPGTRITVATHDDTMAEVARAHGFEVIDPVVDPPGGRA